MKLLLRGSGGPGATRFGRRDGFTMVEIAISLAVVAFALVAIVGVLPTGLQVQKDNREETIINADAAYILEALRTGSDRLNLLSPSNAPSIYWMGVRLKDGRTNEIVNVSSDPWKVIPGQTLLGVLGTPKSPFDTGVSDVVAWVRSLNGSAIDRDPNARDLAFRYQLVAEVQPFVGFPPAATNLLSTNEVKRLNRLQSGLNEVRLTFRWPLINDTVTDSGRAKVGTKRRTIRALVGGSQIYYPTNISGTEYLVYYFKPEY